MLGLTKRQIEELAKNGDFVEVQGGMRKKYRIDSMAAIHETMEALREREHVRQPAFADYFNVSPNMVSKWERGEKGRPCHPRRGVPSIS